MKYIDKISQRNIDLCHVKSTCDIEVFLYLIYILNYILLFLYFNLIFLYFKYLSNYCLIS